MERKLGWTLFLPVLVLVGCDHATKAAARASLPGHVQPLVPGVLDLRYAENHDTAFSLFRAAGLRPPSVLLVALASAAIVAFAVLLWRRRHEAGRLERAGFSLVLGGALGNVLDRVGRGYVVDFIHLHHWPVFNVADVAVVVGGGLLLFAQKRGNRAAPTEPPTAPNRGA